MRNDLMFLGDSLLPSNFHLACPAVYYSIIKFIRDKTEQISMSVNAIYILNEILSSENPLFTHSLGFVILLPDSTEVDVQSFEEPDSQIG